jgi:hypothetical protein
MSPLSLPFLFISFLLCFSSIHQSFFPFFHHIPLSLCLSLYVPPLSSISIYFLPSLFLFYPSIVLSFLPSYSSVFMSFSLCPPSIFHFYLFPSFSVSLPSIHRSFLSSIILSLCKSIYVSKRPCRVHIYLIKR